MDGGSKVFFFSFEYLSCLLICLFQFSFSLAGCLPQRSKVFGVGLMIVARDHHCKSAFILSSNLQVVAFYCSEAFVVAKTGFLSLMCVFVVYFGMLSIVWASIFSMIVVIMFLVLLLTCFCCHLGTNWLCCSVFLTRDLLIRLLLLYCSITMFPLVAWIYGWPGDD